MNRTVFISSTYEDLAAHRRAVWGLLEKFDVNIRGMEQFGARKASPLETCISEVEQSDVYVGIIGFRLGSVEASTAKSFTQLEYERAYELDKEIRIYLIDEENTRVNIKYVDRDIKRDKLEAFKRLLKERHTIDTFVSETDLVEKLGRDLKGLLTQREELQPQEIDEFVQSAKILNKLLLTPKAISGREVRLKVQLQGTLFPASKEICRAFNLGFGETVGVKIKIVNPSGFDNAGIDELYFNARHIEDPSEFSKDTNLDLYAKSQFTDSDITQTRARFKPETVYSVRPFTNLFNTVSAVEMESTYYKADGKIILLFSGLRK